VQTAFACYRRLLECDTLNVSGEIFNICSGVGYSLQDAIEVMREFSGHSRNSCEPRLCSRKRSEEADRFMCETGKCDWGYEYDSFARSAALDV
jgi:nucleoside-diphosphate-sugar epimerase